MKKTIIALVAGATALGVAPASATLVQDLYTGVGNYAPTYFKGYVEVSGLLGSLDQNDFCENGDPMYTIFVPADAAFDGGDGQGGLPGMFDVWDTSWAKTLAVPGFASSITNDHVVEGSISPSELDNTSLTLLVSRSGLKINVSSTTLPRTAPGSIQVNGIPIIAAEQYCNGWIYVINGVLNPKSPIPTQGAMPETQDDKEPAKVASELPNTL